MAAGLDRIVQTDFSSGMFRSVARERIPASGAYDILNGLLDEDGAVYRRGGSAYLATANVSGTIRLLWNGYVTAGLRTVVISSAAGYLLNTDGSLTALAMGGMTTPGRAAAMNGTLYLPNGTTYDGATIAAAAKPGPYYATVANRLLSASGDRIDFSDIGVPGTFGATNFHRLPGGVSIVGMVGLRDSVVVFTTGGVWLIRNLAFNLVDADGNVQQRLDQYSRDFVLWGDAGIAAFEGGLVIPGRDGIWLMQVGVASEVPDAFSIISSAINDLYLEHVRLGRWPGQAAVYRNHYVLPILDSTGVVDLLVCNLTATNSRGLRNFPWTRMDGFGGLVSAVAVQQTSSGPQLIGASPLRVLRLDYFDPGFVTPGDADGSLHDWKLTTRDIPTGPLNNNTVTKLRATYEMQKATSAPVFMDAFFEQGRAPSGGTEWGLFDWGQADWTAATISDTLDGQAPEDLYAATPFSWPVRRRARFARFILSSGDPVARLTLRSLEMFVRSSGRI